MPIYEYICEHCEEKAEIIQRVGEEGPEKCPNCATLKSLHKIVSNSAFHLKGGGWYKDLYSSSKPGAESQTTKVKSSESVSTPSPKAVD
jgi:putative FmdB family regulatory protein